MNRFNICISGSRYANNDHIEIIKDTIFSEIVKICKSEKMNFDNPIPSNIKIIVGDCKGVDKIVRDHLSDYVPIEVHYAEWDKYGKYAGPKRNRRMIEKSNYLIAFPMENSKGTYSTINLAKEHGVEYNVVNLH